MNKFVRWRLFVLVAAVLAHSGCSREVQGNRANVLLVTLETTRADHLSVYGYPRATSPGLEQIAENGALFLSASSVSPRTNPSLASLMTSRYPHQNGVRNLLLPLEPEETTLAEVLHRAGYRTGAVQTHPRLVAGSGLEQGFDDYRDDVRSPPLADQACAAAEKWIRAAEGKGRPWFLWLHLMDPHWTYDPPKEWAGRFGPVQELPDKTYRALKEGRAIIGPIIFQNSMSSREVQGFVDRYDGELAFADDSLRKMLDRLGEPVLSDTLVVVTADHGESLGEHHYFFEHGDFGFEPEIHIPLLFRGPGISPGTRIPYTVESLDVAPTILDILDISAAAPFRGHTLLPLIQGEESDDRTCFGETGKRFHEENRFRAVEGVRGKWRWIRKGRFKMVHRPLEISKYQRLLYDLRSDPGENDDVSGSYPEVSTRLAAELDAMLAEDTRQEREYHITEEAREQLRSLGYVN